MGPLRALAIDMGSGQGGASRSLYFSLCYIDRTLIEPTVWGRGDGPMPPRYKEIGVPYRAIPPLPTFRALPRFSRSLVDFGRAILHFARSRSLLRQLAAEIDGRFDLVHFNHEGLFLVAKALRSRISMPMTMHMRTNCWNTAFARWQMRETAGAIDHFVFITENERETFNRLGGGGEGTVIYNIAGWPDGPVEPHPSVPDDGRFKVGCLSEYSWLRGLDRLVDAAAELARLGRRDVLFVMAGRMRLTRSVPGLLGEIGRRGGTLEDYARARGLDDMFLFLGHVDRPEQVIAACDVVAKPTRENNPWGRDIIEALAAGKPVLTVGSWDTFVTTGETGILQSSFDAAALARDILRLAGDRELCARLGRAGQERVGRLCNGPDRARDLAEVWRRTSRQV